MASVMTGSFLLCCLSAAAYYSLQREWMLSCAITFGVTAYHLMIRFLSPVILMAVFRRKYDCRSRWFSQKKWEPGLYGFLKVKEWKEKASVFTYDPSEFSMEIHTLPEIAENMCHAEAVHELIVVLSFTSLLFAIPFGAFPVFLVTAVLAALMDMQFVIMQRYNRPRILRLMERRGIRK